MGKKRAFIIIQVILGFQGKWDCYNGTYVGTIQVIYSLKRYLQYRYYI